MGILQRQNYLSHWNYFLALERDVEHLSRYIEFSTHNWEAYSLEMARILLAASSETDVLLKALCEKLAPEKGADSINKYKDVIKHHFPAIPQFEALLPRWGLNLTPWSNWDNDDVPIWWTANNKVKHHRDGEFHRANLHNTLNSVAALYVINLYFYRNQALSGELIPMQTLFRPSNEHFGGTTFNDVEFGINYNL